MILSVEVVEGVWRDIVRVPAEGLKEIAHDDGEITYSVAAGPQVSWINPAAAMNLSHGMSTWRITCKHDDGSTSVTMKRLRMRGRMCSSGLELTSS